MNEIYCLIGKVLCVSAGILLGIILIALILHVAVDSYLSIDVSEAIGDGMAV